MDVGADLLQIQTENTGLITEKGTMMYGVCKTFLIINFSSNTIKLQSNTDQQPNNYPVREKKYK